MPPFEERYRITPQYLTAPSKRRSGLPLPDGVKFIVAHDTGNVGSTASANVRYYESSRDRQHQSAHLFVDDREIIECVPALLGPPEKAWHVRYDTNADDRVFGVDANDGAIGVEYCYGPRINGDEAYRKYVWVMAKICHQFRLDPARSVVGHFFLDPQRRSDPNTGLAYGRRTYEGLLRDVVAEYAACTDGGQPPPARPTAAAGTVRTTARLNVRKSAPNRRSPVVRTVGAGVDLDYVGWTDDGEPVNLNSRWYQDADGNYFWSGGVRPA